MAKHIKSPAAIKAAGVGEKRIEEYINRVNNDTKEVSRS